MRSGPGVGQGGGADAEAAVRRAIEDLVPEWSVLNAVDHATYLGYVLGPGAGRHRRAKPIAKWDARATEVAQLSPPVACLEKLRTRWNASVLALGLLCVYSIHLLAQVPWAAAHTPDAGRTVPPATTATDRLREHARIAAERLPAYRRMRAALEQVRGWARERAKPAVD